MNYFQQAKEMAKLSTYYKESIGCIIVYHKSIIATGYNRNKTHPMQAKYDKLRFTNKYAKHSLHAEMSALLSIRYLDIKWSKAHIYIYRLRKNGTKGMAKPCKACMAFIKELGIKNIHYTTYEGYAHEKI